MIGFSLPWYYWFPLVYLVMPGWALAGALAGGVLAYRVSKTSRWLKAIGFALLGSQAIPACILLVMG